jgi:hypothetical protein
VNITRLPTVSNNYVNSWHTSNVTIYLEPDYNVTEIYYSINNGSITNVTNNGQPVITSEDANNTLEYWSVWDVYGKGSIELQHTVVTGIELETNPPQGSIQINNGEASTLSSNVSLTINANSLSGVSQIRFSNDNVWDQAAWEPFTSFKTWQLADGDGLKTVYCQIADNAGLNSTFAASVNLSTPQPLSTSIEIATATPKPSPIISPTPIASSTPHESPTNSATTSASPSVTPQTPELSLQMMLVLIGFVTFAFMAKYNGRNQKEK